MPNIFEGDIMPTCYQIRQQYGEELVETLINEGKLECEEGERNLALLGSTGKLWDTWRNSDGVVEVPFLIDNEFDSIKQKIIVVKILVKIVVKNFILIRRNDMVVSKVSINASSS